MRLGVKGSTAVLLVALTACSNGGALYGITAGTGRAHGTSGSGAGGVSGSSSTGGSTTTTAVSGTSGAAATGSAGSTASGAASGTSGGVTCDDNWVANWEATGYAQSVGDCEAGMLELKGRLANVCTAVNNGRSPPITVPFTGVDLDNPNYQATVGECGSYWFCVPPGTLLTPTFQVQGFYPTVLATLDIVSTPGPEDNQSKSGLSLFCNQLVNPSFLGTLAPPVNLDLGLVAVVIERDFADAGCDDKSGYNFQLFLADGGAVNPPWFYVNGTTFAQNDGGTSGAGLQIFYNLDPALGTVGLSGFKPADLLPDGGDLCPLGSFNPAIAQFTGQIPVVGGQLTYFLWSVP